MADIPIIFSAPMVLALLDGRKTMTRRLAWRVEEKGPKVDDLQTVVEKPSPWQKVKPGDRLWVRERCLMQFNTMHQIRQWGYSADNAAARDDRGDPIIWTHGDRDYCPSIHMRREISRLTLTVRAVKIEKLQAISIQDVRSEGCEVRQFWLFGADAIERQRIAARVFGNLWSDLHGPDSWNANPEVVALSFTVEWRNIDAKVAA